MGNIVSDAFCKTYYFTFTFMGILPFWFDKKSDLQNITLFYKVKVSYSFHAEGISVTFSLVLLSSLIAALL